MNTSLSVKKQITFPKELYDKLSLKSKSFGVSLSEYIRVLSINDVSSNRGEVLSESSAKRLDAVYKRFLEEDKLKPKKRYDNVEDLIQDLDA